MDAVIAAIVTQRTKAARQIQDVPNFRMTSQRPYLECPKCGSYDIVPLVAILNGSRRPPVFSFGVPFSFPFKGIQGFMYRVDLLRQGYFEEFSWDPNTERPTWWCKKCRHPIVSFGPNNGELLAQAWAYIESTFVPTPDEVKDKSSRIRAFKDFVDEIIPQAVREQATAIRVNESAFLMKGEWVSMARFRRLENLQGAIRYGHLPGDIKLVEGRSITVPTHKEKYLVTLRPTSLAPGSIELEVLNHNYPEEFLREIAPRERKAFCPSCGKELRTNRAKQCFECGLDWHESANADEC